MPERETIKRARKDTREGKAPSTQAGEFVREEIEHVRQGKHGARSTRCSEILARRRKRMWKRQCGVTCWRTPS